jgi:glutathione synthase/RimK-type ligase-like ATP-grasp enzyme
LPSPLPDHDVAIVALPDGEASRQTLAAIAALIPIWPRPVLNPPDRIGTLDRDRLFHRLSGIAGLDIPKTARLKRERIEALAAGKSFLTEILDDANYPLIVRPTGTHAGFGLQKISAARDLTDYLAGRTEDEFFLSRFVDYASADGFFRKYRLVVVDGKPYACHMAIADEWKVWYLNAGMADSAARRAQEEDFMTTFDEGFARRHAAALSGAAERLGLEYAGIDCAELPDGRLLVFEGDIALVAHDMDPPEIFPYKGPPMRRLFAAFYEMLKRKSVTKSPSNLKCQAA